MFSPVISDLKSKAGYLVIGHDIKKEQELKNEKEKYRSITRSSEEEYKLTINSIPDYVFLIDKFLIIHMFNDAFFYFVKKLKIKLPLSGKNITQVFPLFPKVFFDEYNNIIKTKEIISNVSLLPFACSYLILLLCSIPLALRLFTLLKPTVLQFGLKQLVAIQFISRFYSILLPSGVGISISSNCFLNFLEIFLSPNLVKSILS